MTTELKYTITRFDDQNKVVDVSYDDGGWARIQLVPPFPGTLEALDNIVRRFAPSIEVIESRKDPKDLSFIHGAVGVERVTQRQAVLFDPFDFDAQKELAEATALMGMQAQERVIRSLMDAVLKEKGLV